MNLKCNLLFLLIASTLIAQTDSTKTKLQFSGNFESNTQWYTNDVNRKIQHDLEPLRSNNYINLNANYGKFSVGSQLEVYYKEALLNFNPQFKGSNFEAYNSKMNFEQFRKQFDQTILGLYFASYKSDKVEITAGHFYEQFGSGLVLRAWEDRSLGINNAFRGVRAKISPLKSTSFTALYARQRTGFEVTTDDILGLNTEINLGELLNFSFAKIALAHSYVSKNSKNDLKYSNFLTKNPFAEKLSNITEINSYRISIEKNSFYLNLEQVIKTKEPLFFANKINYELLKKGFASLVNFGYSQKGLGIDASLRRIENMQTLSERDLKVYSPELTSINFNDRILNFVPSLTKQHHSNLANIYVYQAQAKTALQFDEQIEKFGEIGGQIDIFYNFKKESLLGGKYGTKLSVNASSWFNLKASSFSYFDAAGKFKPTYETEMFKGNQKYFSDYNIEITKKFSKRISSVFSYINMEYNDQYIRGIFNENLIKSNILFAETTVTMQKSKSVTFGLEHMWASADRKNWVSGNLEYNHNENFSVFVMDMYNYGFDPKQKLISETDLFDIHFYNFGGAYRKGSTRIALNYGRQRGGLVCAGGVCRFVPPSTGLGLQLSTSF